VEDQKGVNGDVVYSLQPPGLLWPVAGSLRTRSLECHRSAFVSAQDLYQEHPRVQHRKDKNGDASTGHPVQAFFVSGEQQNSSDDKRQYLGLPERRIQHGFSLRPMQLRPGGNSLSRGPSLKPAPTYTKRDYLKPHRRRSLADERRHAADQNQNEHADHRCRSRRQVGKSNDVAYIHRQRNEDEAREGCRCTCGRNEEIRPHAGSIEPKETLRMCSTASRTPMTRVRILRYFRFSNFDFRNYGAPQGTISELS
jgi:hypothetical protein